MPKMDYFGNKQIQHFSKKRNIARNMICFIRNVIIFIARQNFSTYPTLFTYPFQSPHKI